MNKRKYETLTNEELREHFKRIGSAVDLAQTDLRGMSMEFRIREEFNLIGGYFKTFVDDGYNHYLYTHVVKFDENFNLRGVYYKVYHNGNLFLSKPSDYVYVSVDSDATRISKKEWDETFKNNFTGESKFPIIYWSFL